MINSEVKCAMRTCKTSRRGFTLSEVLITLGIIGIIAAMVLPGLLADYQKKVFLTQLRRSYNITQNAMNKFFWDNNIQKTSEAQAVIWGSDSNIMRNPAIIDTFKKYFKVVDACNEYIEINGVKKCDDNQSKTNGAPAAWWLLLNDGSLVNIAFYNGVGYVYIDVNGIKKPNERGRDVFAFFMSNTSKLIPYCSKEHAEIYGNSYYWKTKNGYCPCDEEKQSFGCTGRIFEENWEMNY